MKYLASFVGPITVAAATLAAVTFLCIESSHQGHVNELDREAPGIQERAETTAAMKAIRVTGGRRDEQAYQADQAMRRARFYSTAEGQAVLRQHAADEALLKTDAETARR